MRSVDLDIRIDDNVTPWLKTVVRSQVPFAAARALTWTAKDGQKEAQRHARRNFVLRNRFTERGIRIIPARKNNLQAHVIFDRYYMVLHEDGGTKTPTRSRFLAVPTREIRRTKTGQISRSQRPSALLDRNDVFVNTLRSSGKKAILQREGRERRPVRVLYIFIPKAEIPDRLDFIKTVLDTAGQRMQRNFEVSMTDALRSSL